MGILDWLFGQKTRKVTAAADPSFRMTIEDVFTIRGACVVVGQIERGTLKVGNEVHLIKGQGAIKEVVVSTIEMFRKELNTAKAGENVGVFLSDVSKDEVQRGNVLAGSAYYNEMVVLGEQSIGLFESMPKHLDAAEKYLDQAEVDFADGVFAPFWDSIENATKCLAHFDEGVHRIKDNSARYTELIGKYEDTPPQFPLARQSVEKLGVGTETAKRMQALVRKAQRNFQFATIYEQRKTNQILVAGFTNLAHALNDMTRRIAASIDDLASSVDGMTSTLNESMQAIHSRMGDIAERTSQHHDELMKEASERATRERKALEMLDNIQRRRQPLP